MKRVLVIASGEKQKEAEESGADFFGGEDIVEKIQKENWYDFDVLISTPDMMKHVGKLGKQFERHTKIKIINRFLTF